MASASASALEFVSALVLFRLVLASAVMFLIPAAASALVWFKWFKPLLASALIFSRPAAASALLSLSLVFASLLLRPTSALTLVLSYLTSVSEKT